LKKLIDYLRTRGIAIIADEVQTGFGRTGKMFACEHFNIQPDMMTLSKSLGAGLAISAVIVNDEKFPNLEQGMHSGSHCADPIACAAAIANIDFILENGLVEQSANHGAYLLGQLNMITRKRKEIIDVRGLGLMIGVELVKDRKSKRTAVEDREKIIWEAFRHGLVLIPAGESTIRIYPPLIIGKEDITTGLEILSNAMEKI